MSTGGYYNGNRYVKAGIHTTAKPEPTGGRSIVHGSRRAARTFDIGSIDADEILHVIQTVVKAGDNVSFTLTSDGGALCTCVLANELRHKCYGKDPEEVYAKWSELLAELY